MQLLSDDLYLLCRWVAAWATVTRVSVLWAACRSSRVSRGEHLYTGWRKKWLFQKQLLKLAAKRIWTNLVCITLSLCTIKFIQLSRTFLPLFLKSIFFCATRYSYKVVVVQPEADRSVGRPRPRSQRNIHWILKKQCDRVWTGFSWLKIGSSCFVLWTGYWSMRLYKRWVISWQVVRLLTSQ